MGLTDEERALILKHRKAKRPAWTPRPLVSYTRLGVYGKCEVCGGHGDVFTAPAATLGLVVWYLHPRKGCSRGVRVKEIRRDELPVVLGFLKQAADRNAERFAAVVKAAGDAP